jgi:hypothetical protein
LGMSNRRVQTGVLGIGTLHGGVVELIVLLHCGLTVLFDVLKDDFTLDSGIWVNCSFAVVLQSV